MWTTWVNVMWDWVFPVFITSATGAGLMAMWLGMAGLLRRALMATLEVATLLEAAREAKRQGRGPILRVWLKWPRRSDR